MKLLAFIVGLLGHAVASQSHFLVGYAPEFSGKKVMLYTCQEYVTMKKIPLGEAVVNTDDSLFKIPLTNRLTVKGLIEIDGAEAELYLAPDSDYDIYFHRPKGPESFNNQRALVTFFGLDSTDINYRILQYHQWFDTFVAYYEPEISRGQFQQYLDTFKLYAADAYKDIRDPYFLTYVRFNIAEMDQTMGGIDGAEQRLNTFLEYIGPFPVYHENDQYMKFVLGFYEQEFDDYDPATEREIFAAIDSASPTMLMKALKRDLFLANPELREMMMIERLGKQFYKSNYDKAAILLMLDSLEYHAKYQMNANTAKNIKAYLTSLERGFPAPVLDLNFIDPLTFQDSTLTWRSFEGKFVYLNFFNTWDSKTQAEMGVMTGLYAKYGEDVAFVSLCTDKTEETFKKYVSEHPQHKWDLLYIGENHPLLKLWKVQMTPAYFLIDQGGYIMAAPALRPSPDGEYESIDKTFFYIQRVLHPNYKPKVGQP